MTNETTRDVLRDALEMHATHEGPTPREALQITIRMECARAGLPKPDFNHFPPWDLATSYMASIGR